MNKILVATIAVGLAACGTGPLPAGAQCTANGDCDATLSCLDIGQFSGSACTVVGKTCSITCTGDAACASLGSDFRCLAGCGSAMSCNEVASP